MKSEIILNKEYKEWLLNIKEKILSSQLKAAVRLNSELLVLYWELGAMIVEKQSISKWGDGLLKQLSKDLQSEFSNIKGFSETNLKYIRKWYLFYNQDNVISQQAVDQLPSKKSQQAVDINIPAQLASIPWGHHIQILSKCSSLNEALFYIQKTIENNWSRNVLVHQIESGLNKRYNNEVNNFQLTLPTPQSDLANQTLKNTYVFDFLTLTENYKEHELETALIDHITKFLLELGTGFSYMGKQYHLNVNGDDFYIDLLFYHVRLHCYVVVELKTGKFQPEFAGKLNFYLSVVDDTIKSKSDNPSIGLLICKEQNKVVAEYALRDIKKPMGISEYRLTKDFPKELKGSLPSVDDIELELKDKENK